MCSFQEKAILISFSLCVAAVGGSEIRGTRLGQLKENTRSCRQLQHSSISAKAWTTSQSGGIVEHGQSRMAVVPFIPG